MAGRSRYEKSPKIAKKEEKAKPEKDEKAAAEPEEKGKKMDAPVKDEKSDEGGKGGPKSEPQAGDEPPVHDDVQVRHGAERKDMNERHEDERSGMTKRHEKEHKKLAKRHGKEMGHDMPDEDGETEE